MRLCETPAQHAFFCAISTDPPRMDYWWSLKEMALKTYTVFWHASSISEISIYMRLNYIVSALNPPLVSGSPPPLINHGWRTAAIRWDPSNDPTFTFDGRSFPRTSKLAMSKDLWIGISGNFHLVLICIRNNCASPATILVQKYLKKLFSWNGQNFY